MGCSSDYAIKEACEDEETVNAFQKLEQTIKVYKEAIEEYKKYLEEYGDVLEQKVLCEKLINSYFKLQKRVIITNEPQEIRNYRHTFNRVNRLEEKLNITPGCLLNYHKKQKEKEEKKKKEEEEKKKKEEKEKKKKEEEEKKKKEKEEKKKKEKKENKENNTKETEIVKNDTKNNEKNKKSKKKK